MYSCNSIHYKQGKKLYEKEQVTKKSQLEHHVPILIKCCDGATVVHVMTNHLHFRVNCFFIEDQEREWGTT